jgi:hypothetical protein
MFGLLPNRADYLLDLLLSDPLPLARLIPLLRGLLTHICDCHLEGCEVEPLLHYLLPVVVLLSIVFFEVINFFVQKMFFSCNLLLELLHRGLHSLRVIEKECLLSSQFIQYYFAVYGRILSNQSSFLIDINNGARICTVELSNVLELLFGNLLCRFKLLLHFGFNFIPFNNEYFSCLFFCYFSMVSLNVPIDRILQGFVANKLILLLIELSQ